MKKKYVRLVVLLTVMMTLSGCDILTGPSKENSNVSQKTKEVVKSSEKELKVEEDNTKNTKSKEEKKEDKQDVAIMQQDVSMDAILKKKLDTFFSNFSEANVKPFKDGNIANKDLIDFGIVHNYINNKGLIKKMGNQKGRLSAKYVDYSVRKYFDKIVQPHESPNNECSYKDGIYIFPITDKNNYSFSQITRLIDNKDGTYTAFINIYLAPITFKNVHSDVKVNPNVKLKGQMKAIIKKVNNGEKERYILKEYSKIN